MSSLPHQIVTVVSGRGVIRIAQFATFILLARALSPEHFGWFGIVTTALVLAATLGTFGFRQSLAYELGQGRITPGEANGIVLLLWPVFTAISAAAVVVLYAHKIPSLSYADATILIVCGVAGAVFLMLIQGNYLGRGRIASFTVSESLPRLLLLIGIVAMASMGSLTLSSALWTHVGAFALVIPVAAWLAMRHAGRLRIRIDRMGPMLSYGLIFALNLFLITLGSRLAIFVIEFHTGAAEAGRFFAAVRVNEIFLEVATAVGMVVFSHAARESSSKVAVLERNAKIASCLVWLFAVLAVLVAAFAPYVVLLVLGPNYAGATVALQVLALGLPPAAANKVIYPTLAGIGRPFFGTPVIIVGLLVNLALALVLVPQWGAAGGAMAVVAGQYCIFIGYMITCRLRYALPPKSLLLLSRDDLSRLRTLISQRRARMR